jgi:hypothetical protein
MDTQCIPTQLEFHALGKREVVGKFDGGSNTSDAGGLLLRETEKRTGIPAGFARCFEDLRTPKLLLAAVHILRRFFALCAIASEQHRRIQGHGRGIEADRREDPQRVARSEDHRARRLGFLPR